MNRPVTYFFEHALPDENSSEFLITILKREEPHPWEYVKSFFGLFGSVPEIVESSTTYVLEPDGDWTDIDTGEQVTDVYLVDMLFMIDMNLRKEGGNPHDIQYFVYR